MSQPGQPGLLGDRYRLVAEIARGGMAVVYRAIDTRHDRQVAVKLLDPGIWSPVAAARFHREIGFASGLNHPGIVPVFDSGAAGETLYFVMPFIDGESLRGRLDREGALPIADALRIAREVADALGYAHSAGVVHRDIKPENVMFAGGHAMVTDFGIARAVAGTGVERLTSASMAIGTPAYMAPEQADSAAQIDGRADVYALGCVLFEMLAGEPPFGGRNAQVVMARHQAEHPPSLRVVRPTVPSGVQTIVERALAKVPSDRFATAGAFAAALDAEQESVSGAASSSRRARGGRARRWMVSGAVALAVATIWWRLAGNSEPVSANKVVVFPFGAPGAASPTIGEEVALLVGSALEHTEPLVWVDGSSLIGRRADLGAGEAARAARRVGARYFTTGAIVATGDSLVVIVRLSDATRDSLIRQESAAAPAQTASAPELALRAIALILPRLLPPNGRVDLSYVAERNASAVANWLQGERAYARGQFGDAMELMGRAVAEDSAMGVAALKGAQAATWLQDYVAAGRLLEVALRNDRQLPRQQVALAQGLQFFLAGAADSAAARFAAAQRADQTWSEPWSWLGQTYHQLLPAGSAHDSVAGVYFERALALTPMHAPSLYYTAELAAIRGDRRRARSLASAFQAASGDSGWVEQLMLVVRCAADGPDGVDWPGAVARIPERVVNVGRALGGGMRNAVCSRRAYEAVLGFDRDTSADHRLFRWTSLKGLDFLMMARGDDRAAVALVDSAVAGGYLPAQSLYVIDAAAGGRAADSAAAGAVRTVITTISVSRMGADRLHYLSLWASHIGDGARLDSVARRAQVLADSTGRATDRLLAPGTAARLALLHGDTSTAIARLRDAVPAGDIGLIAWNPWASAAHERILLARLLFATGQMQKAADLAETFDSPRSQVDVLYTRPAFEIRAAAADRFGRRSEAARLRERMAALLR